MAGPYGQSTDGPRRDKTREVGKKYIAGEQLDIHYPPATRIQAELLRLEREQGLTSPDEPIANLADEDPRNTLGITVRPYGLRRFRDLYTSRQQLALLKFVHFTRIAQKEMNLQDLPIELATATTAALSLVTSRFSNFARSTLHLVPRRWTRSQACVRPPTYDGLGLC